MFSILLACLIVVAIVMVAVILLQKSEGGGMSGSQAASMFGGALTGASAGNFFTKLTAWLAAIFFALCASLAFIVSREGTGVNGRSEVRAELIKADTPKVEPVAAPLPDTLEMPETPEIPEN